MMTLLEVINNADLLPPLLLSLLGGVGSYLQGCRSGELQRTLFNLFTELVLAITIGLAIVNLGEWLGWNPALTSLLVILAANNGGDSLAKSREVACKYIYKKIGN